jgi:hypothetical protein
MHFLGHVTNNLSRPRLSEEVERLSDVLTDAVSVGMIDVVHGDASYQGPQMMLRFGFVVHVPGLEQSLFRAAAPSTTRMQPRHRSERIFFRLDVS